MYMKAKVPTMDTGRASVGMMVADSVFRNRKMTSTTSAIAIINVSCTSWMDSRIEIERSLMTETETDAGSWD